MVLGGLIRPSLIHILIHNCVPLGKIFRPESSPPPMLENGPSLTAICPDYAEVMSCLWISKLSE